MLISKKKSLFSLVLCMMILFTSCLVTTPAVYATNMTTSVELTENVAIEALDSEGESVVEKGAEEDNEPVIFDWDLYYNASLGQIDGTRFTDKAVGMYPLALSATVKDGFDADCYIYLTETDHQDRKIRIDLYPEEDFTRTVYFPAGYYQVEETGVKNAPSISFTSNSASVSLGDSETPPIVNIVLNNADNVKQNELGEWMDTTLNASEEDNKLYGVEALKDKGIQSDTSGVFHYSVTHTGPEKTRLVDKEVSVERDGQTVIEIQQVEEIYYGEPGLGYVTPFGSATQSADIVLLIHKGGVVGQAEFKVSYDGGQTFTAKFETGDAVLDENINLTYNFYALNDTDEFTEGDRFYFSSVESFKIKNTEGSANTRISCVGHPTSDHELKVEILSSGGRGVSRVKVTDEKGSLGSKTYLIPKDGVVLLDDNLTLYFENVNGYVKGVYYTIPITSHDMTIDYTPLIALCVIAATGFMAALIWLLLKKDRASDYIVHAYEWKQDESAYKN